MFFSKISMKFLLEKQHCKKSKFLSFSKYKVIFFELTRHFMQLLRSKPPYLTSSRQRSNLIRNFRNLPLNFRIRNRNQNIYVSWNFQILSVIKIKRKTSRFSLFIINKSKSIFVVSF